jgi:hypothetical protein
MVGVEAFTKWVVLVPLRNKEPVTTAFAYQSAIYAYYGGCAQLVTDQGREWTARFDQLMQQLCIDHRTTSAYHPQSNGMAERTVATVKASLQKVCAAATDKLAWDWQLPAIMLGYNCSKQQSTKLSPFQLMHGITPMLPAQLQQTFGEPVDPTQEQAAQIYYQRAQLLSTHAGVAWQNLLIAQHRDRLRYARKRDGSQLSALEQLKPGSLVYLRTVQGTGLSLPAQPTILRVVKLAPSGVVTLQGGDGNLMKRHVSHLAPCHLPNVNLTINRQLQLVDEAKACEVCGSPDKEELMLLCDSCNAGYHTFCLQPPLSGVPPGHWVCPECSAAGVSKQQVEEREVQWQQQQDAQQQQERLSRAWQEAAALDGRWIRHHQPGASGWRGEVSYGQLVFLGAAAGKHPKLRVLYQNGETEEITARACSGKLRRLLPPGDQPPARPTACSVQLACHANSPAATLQWVRDNPWRVQAKDVLQPLLESLPSALQPATCHWAAHVWLAPELTSWKQHVQHLCWWAKVVVLRSCSGVPPFQGLPLLICADTGSTSQDLLQVHAGSGEPVVLCILQLALRERQRQLVAAAPGVVLQRLRQGTAVQPWAIWQYPAWQQLRWAQASALLSAGDVVKP